MVNVPPLLCSTPPPIDFVDGDDNDDSGLPTLNLDESDEFSDYGLVSTTNDTGTNVNVPHSTTLNTAAVIPKTELSIPTPDLDSCYMTRITPPPFEETIDKQLCASKPIVEAFNFQVAFDAENFLHKNGQQDINVFPPIDITHINNTNDIDEEDIDVEEEDATNVDNVPSLKLDSLSLYSSESVSSNTLSPSLPLDETVGEESVNKTTAMAANICNQVLLEDIDDDSSDEYSPKKRKSLIVNENADDFFSIHVIPEKIIDTRDSNNALDTIDCLQSSTDSDVEANTDKTETFVALQAAEPNVNDDDFAEFEQVTNFADFPTQFEAFSAAAQFKPASPIQSTEDAQQSTEIDNAMEEDDDFDDFQDFAVSSGVQAATNLEENQTTKQATKNNNAELSQIQTAKEIEKNTYNDDADDDNDDDDDDFGDFSEASVTSATVPVSNVSTHKAATNLIVPPLPPPAVTKVNIGEKVKPVLEMMFPQSNELQVEGVLGSAAPVDDSLKFSAIELARALEYQWNNSEIRLSLIKSLGIDSRNILFSDKWNSSMPRFAANLSLDPLKPLKPESATSSFKVNPAQSRLTIVDETAETANAIMSSGVVDFDWKQNDLTNPIDDSTTVAIGGVCTSKAVSDGSQLFV